MHHAIGEYRKSFHGFASPTAYVIDSPQSLMVVPMQIDTWNRDAMNITGSKYVPGPQVSTWPKGSPRGLPLAMTPQSVCKYRLLADDGGRYLAT